MQGCLPTLPPLTTKHPAARYKLVYNSGRVPHQMQPDSTGRVGAALTWKDLFPSQRLSRDLQQGRALLKRRSPLPAPGKRQTGLWGSRQRHLLPALLGTATSSLPSPFPSRPPHSSAPHLGNPLENPKYVVNACVNLVNLITSGRLISLAAEPH